MITDPASAIKREVLQLIDLQIETDLAAFLASRRTC